MYTAELKSRAKEQLKGNWAIAIGTVLVANIIMQANTVFKVISNLDSDGLTYSLDLVVLLLSGVISVCLFNIS